jgi:hypothetical protein
VIANHNVLPGVLMQIKSLGTSLDAPLEYHNYFLTFTLGLSVYRTGVNDQISISLIAILSSKAFIYRIDISKGTSLNSRPLSSHNCHQTTAACDGVCGTG